MVRRNFELSQYGWIVYAYYVVTKPNAEEILGNLAAIDCPNWDMRKAKWNLYSGKLDTGLTYSNKDTRESVMVFAKTSCAREFQQSYQHEIGHLKDHIAQTFGINPHGEEIQYIGDEIIAKTWDVAKELLCDCCRKM